MALNLPDANKVPGDSNHTSDTNLIIEAINTLKSQVDGIPAGPTGAKGDTGAAGAAGTPATVTVGSTTTSAAGGNAAVTNSGTASNAILNFTIPRGAVGPKGDTGATGAQGPKGDPGDNAAISIGTTTTGDAGTSASVTNSGTLTNAVLNFTIPRGETGPAANLGTATPQNLGTAGAGTAPAAAREDHVHNMPSASDVGADPVGSASAAQSAAQAYADGLASNYDPAGAASTAVTNHAAVTTSVHGITNTANLVYTDDSRLSDARTPTAHATSHESGGSDALELAPSQITGTAIVEGDSRLSDARTPVAHSASHEFGGADALELAPSQITGTAVVDSDSRLTDARTPTAHAASHGVGQSDAITVAQSQVTNLTSDLSAKAPLDSPTFTGVPAAPTAAQGTNTTQLATTAYVQTELANVDALPDQTGNSGKYLTTDGTNASWASITTDPTPSIFFLGGM